MLTCFGQVRLKLIKTPAMILIELGLLLKINHANYMAMHGCVSLVHQKLNLNTS